YLVDFALIQSDVAETMYKGRKELQQFPNSNLRSMASLWPEAVHIVVLEGSGIKTFKGISGKRVAVGTPGSGSRFNAVRIARAIGLSQVHFPEILEFGVTEAVAALEAGKVDVIFVTEAVPSVALQQLSSRRSDVRFLSLERDLINTLSEQQFAYYPVTVPMKTYPGQSKSFITLGLTALLVTHQRVADDTVEKVLEMLLDSRSELAKKYYRAGFISSATMRLGIAVPLHPGAEKFYAQRKSQDDKE
ncbi:MAG: TAXI family TRAP transporter solute-binding subunit, partial [Methyloprofundus sp.]|nr:TAXI family TRAP transporter solute-binding subunit [Methyloprofundus sp.]